MPIEFTRAYHLNVNCASLDRSRLFYVDLLGLTPLTRTNPPVQPGHAFGLEHAQWDAWILAGNSGASGGVVLDLLEWKVPAPTGHPAARSEQGFGVFGVAVTDVDDTVRSLRGAGHRASDPVMSRPQGPRVAFADDPDGQMVELIEAGERRLSHVVVNVADLQRSRSWYDRVLGLSGTVVETDEWRTCYLTTAGVRWMIALREWRSPALVPRAPRRANELGVFRHALFSPDVEADYERLCDLGVVCYSPPAALDMGPGLPSDLKAVFFDDPDGACLELIQPPLPSS